MELYVYAPLTAALVGVVLVLIGLRRRAGSIVARLAGSWDLLWCGCALLCKSWIFYAALSGHPHPRVLWFDLGLIAGLLLLLLFLPRLLRAWSCFAIVALVSLWIWGDLIHWRFFRDVATFATLLSAGNGTELIESALALSRKIDKWLFLDFAAALPLVVLLSVRGRARAADADGEASRALPRRLTAEAFVALWLLIPLTVPGLLRHRELVFKPDNNMERRVFVSVNLVRHYGLLGFHLNDAYKLIRKTWRARTVDAAALESAVDWFAERAPSRAATGKWAGYARGKNLILVQVESMQSYTVQTTFNDTEITPNINRLASSALVFTGAVDQSGLGRTSDTELLAMVSLLPSTDRAASFAFGGNKFVGLASLLRDHGYTTLSAVPFRPGFWNRHITHPGYGFSTSLFGTDFEAGRKIGWGLNDREFLTQMLDRVEQLPRPFFAWLMTLSLHTPYAEWPEDLKALPDSISDDERLRNYLEAMHFFDTGFGEFFDGLERRGLLEESVLVFYGDHDAGMARRRLLRLLGRNEKLRLEVFDNVPLMMWVPGEDGPRGDIHTISGLSDLPVTLLALLGIDPAPFAFVGRNLLGTPAPTAVPLSGGRFAQEDFFLSRKPRLCFSRQRGRRVKMKFCEPALATDLAQREVSALVLEHDLQVRITDALHRRLGRVQRRRQTKNRLETDP